MATNRIKERDESQILALSVRGLFLLTMGTVLMLAACASPPPQETVAPVAAPPPSVEVYFYPKKGQSKAQQDRDRYECYLWARDQTGFDPSAPQLPPSLRVKVEPTAPPGQETAAGAVTGAVLGAAVSRRGEKAEGAVKGAIAGAIIGAASEQARAEQAKRIEEQQQQQIEAQHAARLEQQATNYRRAMAACLEGRGYEVR